MVKNIVTILVLVLVSLGFGFMVGCASDAQTGAAIGSLAGAGIGQLAGGDTESTLIGAALGGGVGYIFGNEGDKKKANAEMAAIRTEQNVVTVWVTNSNGSQRPVRLRRDGPGYIGPRSERYPSMPSEEQLRMVYGF